MQTLPRTGIQIPDLTTDPFAIRAHLGNIANGVEQQSVIFTTGVAGTRPAAGKPGRVHFFTDTGETWWDTGATWVQVNPAPVANAAAATPSLRRLGTSSTDAAAGSHAAQHAPGGVDPLPAGPRVVLRRSTPLIIGSAPTSPAIAWDSLPYTAMATPGMWSAGTPSRVTFPAAGVWLVTATAGTGATGISLETSAASGVYPAMVALSLAPAGANDVTQTGWLVASAGGWIELRTRNTSGAGQTLTLLDLALIHVSS